MQMPIGSPTCWNASNEDCKCKTCKDAQCGYGCVKNAGVEIADMANYPHMRLLMDGGRGAKTPQLESRNSGWRTPNATGGGFSATCERNIPVHPPSLKQWVRPVDLTGMGVCVGWFFGRDLYKSLTPPRPLGLIETNVGGTPDQHWSSPEALAKCKNIPGAYTIVLTPPPLSS
jgi:hypothetical protein